MPLFQKKSPLSTKRCAVVAVGLLDEAVDREHAVAAVSASPLWM